MRIKWKLTVASLKMFLRQREALIWTLLLPLLMILLFSLVDFEGIGQLQIGVAGADSGDALVSRLQTIRTVNVYPGLYEAELRELEKGGRDLLVVVPRSETDEPLYNSATAYSNSASADEGELASVVVQQILDEISRDNEGTADRRTLPVQELHGRSLTYIDFLVPGIISMSIMQMGIFGVAFSFVSLKKRGILRRLSVTPIQPNDFILAQIVMRLFVVMMQISVLVGIGVVALDFHFEGSLANMFLIGCIGAFVFLGMGFAIAGVSKTEDQVAPLANIVVTPMIVLSGVFFSRAHLPDIIHSVTEILPLTFLADSMRAIAIDGAGIDAVLPQLAGLLIWLIIASFTAVKFFRWE